jgi:hypothetical protein
MNNKILLVNPPEALRKSLHSNENYIFYDKWCFSLFVGGKRSILFIDDINLDTNFDFDQSKNQIILNRITPIWNRWLRSQSNAEDTKFSLSHNLEQIKQFLKAQSIIHAFFFTAIPHHIDTSSISSCCHSLKIMESYFYNTALTNARDGLLHINGSGLFSKRTTSVNDTVDEDAMADILDFQANTQKENTPTWVPKRRKWQESFIIGLFAGVLLVLKGKLNKTHVSYSSGKTISQVLSDCLNQKIFLKKYHKLSKKFIQIYSETPSILIAAHYQPEATTVPEGGIYANHVDVVLKIRSTGFKGEIFYKEHPTSRMYLDPDIGLTGVGGYRSSKYLKTLKSLGVKVVPISTPVSHFQKSWIVTITGSVAIERSLAGLQTIVAGSPWFEGLPGNIPICQMDSEDFEAAVRSASNSTADASRIFLHTKLSGNVFPDLQSANSDDGVNKYIDLFESILRKGF